MPTFACATSMQMEEKLKCAAMAPAALPVLQTKLPGDLVTLQMTEPTDLRLKTTLRVMDENKTVHFINSGVPHVVIPVLQLGDVDVQGAGSAIRHHKMFSPKGTNVNFLEKRGPKQIAVRTYERGVEAETLA